MLTVTEPVALALATTADIHGTNNVSKGRHMLLHVGPHLVDESCLLHHELRIRGISHIGFLDVNPDPSSRGPQAERRCPHGDLIGDLPLRLGR